MSATVAAALKKAAVYILGDEKSEASFVTAVLSAAVGSAPFCCVLPAVMLSSLGRSARKLKCLNFTLMPMIFYSSLDSESRQRLDDIRSAGNDIANAMDEKGVKVQTIKAQLIYMSYF